MQKQIDELIEHKCKELSKTSSKGGAIHLEQWMKGQLGCSPLEENFDHEPEPEFWTEEELRKRTEDLQLVDVVGRALLTQKDDNAREENRCDDPNASDHDHSPSRSTTTESQVLH